MCLKNASSDQFIITFTFVIQFFFFLAMVKTWKSSLLMHSEKKSTFTVFLFIFFPLMLRLLWHIGATHHPGPRTWQSNGCVTEGLWGTEYKNTDIRAFSQRKTKLDILVSPRVSWREFWKPSIKSVHVQSWV